MKTQDILDLIQIRNYAISSLMDRSVVSGDDYKKMNQKIRELDQAISGFILTFDVKNSLDIKLTVGGGVSEDVKQTVLAKPKSKKFKVSELK